MINTTSIMEFRGKKKRRGEAQSWREKKREEIHRQFSRSYPAGGREKKKIENP